MVITEITTPRGALVRIHDPLEKGTPEWHARQKRWEKAVQEFARKEMFKDVRSVSHDAVPGGMS